MRKIYLHSLDREVAHIALGTAGFDTDRNEKTFLAIMDAYANMGGNLLDTARVYGEDGYSEKVIGKWLRANGCRKDMVIATKGGHPELSTMTVGRLDRKNLEYDIAKTQEDMGVDCVDIYYLHRDDVTRSVADIMETLHGFVKKGYVKVLGTSNWSAKRIAEANAYAARHSLTPFLANEPQWSLAQMIITEDPTLRGMDSEMLQLHKETNMLCMPFTSQAKGFFTKLHALGEAGLPDKAKRRYLCAENLKRYERLVEVTQRAGISVNAGALAYLTSRSFPVCPVAGVSSVAQVQSFEEASQAQLSEADIRYLDLE